MGDFRIDFSRMQVVFIIVVGGTFSFQKAFDWSSLQGFASVYLAGSERLSFLDSYVLKMSFVSV